MKYIISQDIILKGRKGYPVGTERKHGGKLMKKTENVWVPVGKKREPVISREDIHLSKQSDIDNFKKNKYSGIIGKLIIEGPGVKDISALKSLRVVTKDIIIRQTDIKSVKGLSSLIRAGSLEIKGNYYLKNLDGLENFMKVKGDVDISHNQILENDDGLKNLREKGELSGIYDAFSNGSYRNDPDYKTRE